MQRRVVVTGLGLVTSLATGLEESWAKLLAGESGIRRTQKIDASAYTCQISGEVLDFNPDDWVDKKVAKRTDPHIHFAVAATRMAWEMAGLPTPLDRELGLRAGTIIGVGLGGVDTLENMAIHIQDKGPSRISPFSIPRLIGNMAPGIISIEFGLLGPNLCVSTACAAGTHATGEAYRQIQLGVTDVMVCGGAESVISPAPLAGFCAARALSTRNDEPHRASRPFDAGRDGFIMSEGAGCLVLEELEHAKARGAAILAEVTGYGLSSDAHHMTAPDPSADGFVRCMQMALDSSGLGVEDIDYINAHGTSTGLNDAAESKAIRDLFGEAAYKVAVSSTKSMIGHSLGATGGVEAVVSTLAIRDQVMPPTINYEEPDPECDLDYVPNQKREGVINHVLSNSFGFGGTNGTLILSRYQQ